MVSNQSLEKRILKLKQEKKAIILVHNYQRPEVQDIADFTGDSLELSQKAAATDAEVIVFCGVHFMAETAAILSPEKAVLLPDANAGCPMADMITAAQLRQKKRELPAATVVTYVNSTAAVKAESDYCCTSSNGVKVVASLDSDEILFIQTSISETTSPGRPARSWRSGPATAPPTSRYCRKTSSGVRRSARGPEWWCTPSATPMSSPWLTQP